MVLSCLCILSALINAGMLRIYLLFGEMVVTATHAGGFSEIDGVSKCPGCRPKSSDAVTRAASLRQPYVRTH